MSGRAGRLRRCGHRLQVADIIVLRAAGSTSPRKIKHFTHTLRLDHQQSQIMFDYLKNIMKGKEPPVLK